MVTAEERDRFESREWVRERLAKHGAAITPAGPNQFALPMVERDRKLVCLFLDDDGLCSQYKNEGRDFWSTSCKGFPFAFVRDETGQIRASLTHVCPSIRDGYGKPLEPQLPRYLNEAGGRPAEMADHLTLQGRTRLDREAYGHVIAKWEELMETAPTASGGLLALFDFTTSLTGQLLDSEEPDAEEVTEAMREAGNPSTEAPKSTGTPLLPRLVLGLSLSTLAYPLRTFNGGRFSPANALATWRVTSRLVKGRGEIDLLLMPQPFELADAMSLPAPLADPELAAEVKRYFRLALERRNLFTSPRDLNAIVLDLVLGHALIARTARYHAAASGHQRATVADIRAGVSTAEALVLYHFSAAPKPPMLESMMALLATNRPAITSLLAEGS